MKKYRSEKNSSICLFGRNEHSYMCNTNEPRQIFVESTWFCHFSALMGIFYIFGSISIVKKMLQCISFICNLSDNEISTGWRYWQRFLWVWVNIHNILQMQ